MKSRIMGELKKVFRPELLNRIDEVIVFHKLAKDEIGVIVDLMMRRLREQMKEHEVSIELSQDAVELLAEKGYDPAMGARPLRRTIQNLIEDPLADFVLSRQLPAGATIVIDRKKGVDADGNPTQLDEVDLDVVAAATPPEPEPAAVGAGTTGDEGEGDESKPDD